MAAAAPESLKVVEAAPVGAAEEAEEAAALETLLTAPPAELEELAGALDEAALEEAALEELIIVELAAELEAAEELLWTGRRQAGCHMAMSEIQLTQRWKMERR